MGDWVTGGFEFDDTPEARDPDLDGQDADMGLKISKVSFKELIEAFPDTTQVSSGSCEFDIHTRWLKFGLLKVQ